MNQEKIKQVKTKNPKRVAASKKSYEERMLKMMLKMKKDILENAGSNDTKSDNDVSSNDGGTIVKSNNNSNESVSSNDGGTIGTKSNNDVYFYGIGGGLLIIAIGFLIYYKFNPQKKSVEVNTKVDAVYRRML